jgi:hypothetical protein
LLAAVVVGYPLAAVVVVQVDMFRSLPRILLKALSMPSQLGLAGLAVHTRPLPLSADQTHLLQGLLPQLAAGLAPEVLAAVVVVAVRAIALAGQELLGRAMPEVMAVLPLRLAAAAALEQ